MTNHPVHNQILRLCIRIFNSFYKSICLQQTAEILIVSVNGDNADLFQKATLLLSPEKFIFQHKAQAVIHRQMQLLYHICLGLRNLYGNIRRCRKLTVLSSGKSY